MKDFIDKEFLVRYLNSNSPTGYEVEGQKIWVDYIEKYVDDLFLDYYGSAVGIINPEAEYKVVIEAHADEISWAVNYITKEGYIYVARNGGSDFAITSSMRALVHLDDGRKIPAVFGTTPIHLKRSRDEEKVPDITSTVLDCGCDSDEEVKNLGIHVGSIVTFDAEVLELNGGKYIVARAADNRAGGIIIASVAKLIHENKDELPFGLYICNCVQEEVGLCGASMIAHSIKPNLAIVTDVTHDTQSPFYNKVKNGDISCGQGPVLVYAPPVHHNLFNHIKNTAEENNIKIQYDYCSGYSGTDTDSIAYSRKGIPSALISLPQKYMHTTVEMFKYADINAVIDLMYKSLLGLSPDFEVKYFDVKRRD